MNSLADVEMHLIMHGLTANDLLKLARCSHRSRSLVRQPFAWKHSPIIQLTAMQLSIFNSSSMCHSSVSLHWPGARLCLTGSYVDRLLAMTPTRGLQELNAANLELSNKLWKQILSHSSMRQLRVLRLSLQFQLDIDLQLMQLITSLPYLHTLDLFPNAEDPSLLSLLSSAPALTSLGIREQRPSILPYITQCSQLKFLLLKSPRFTDVAWHGFFASPYIQQLESLSIDHYSADGKALRETPPSPEEYANTFRSMRCLHSLTLARVTAIDVMLPYLAHAPSLRCLVLQSEPEVLRSSIPSIAVLSQLMRDQPMLSCIIESSKENDPDGHERWSELIASAELSDIRGRFVFRSTSQ